MPPLYASARPERRSIDVEGRTVHYQVAGTGSPLILVHGLSGSARWWSRNLAALASHFQVFAVDLPGFGDNRGRGRFVLAAAAAHLVAWMDGLEIARASFVGHSMGGYIVGDLAATHPGRLDRLVLVDATLVPYDRRFWQPAWGGVGLLRRLPVRFLPTLVADAMRAGPTTLRHAGLQLLAADLRSHLNRIEAPALVIWGANDTLVPLIHGRRLVEALPDARLVVIPGAGHNPMWDQPDAFNQEVIAFLTTAASGSEEVETT